MDKSNGPGGKPQVPGEPFLPFKTMFKLCPPRPGAARQLECVSCGMELEWRIYTIAPEKFDNECPACGVKADHYWCGSPSREIPDATEE